MTLEQHELIVKYNFKAETHFIETEDGYILRLHRLAKPGQQPFLLMHGLSDTSATYLMTGPSKSLGFAYKPSLMKINEL